MPSLSSSTNSLDSDICGVAEGGERNEIEILMKNRLLTIIIYKISLGED